jgi:hypothetical protein
MVFAMLHCAGGGGGATDYGGGGGAGGLVHRTNYPVQPGAAYAIIVGRGGAGGQYGGTERGQNGEDSRFGSDSSLIAKGGGGGLSSGWPYTSTGGSGGGMASSFFYVVQVSTATPGQGNMGGASSSAFGEGAGGGGGADSEGQAGSLSLDPTWGYQGTGGSGGSGMWFLSLDPEHPFAIGGGGYGKVVPGGGAWDGSGAGGTGTLFKDHGVRIKDGAKGADGRGNGGGGTNDDGNGGAGGSGIVILRYSPGKCALG